MRENKEPVMVRLLAVLYFLAALGAEAGGYHKVACLMFMLAGYIAACADLQKTPEA